MDIDLPDGLYPFIHSRHPLADLQMTEMPQDLENLLRDQAEKSGIRIIRGQPVEIVCSSKDFEDAVFLVYWPEKEDRLHMLAPKEHVTGKA